jgi:hypothetical protein
VFERGEQGVPEQAGGGGKKTTHTWSR